jgi:zinc protease
VDYLQKYWCKIRATFKRYTSFDETVYFLPFPDSPEKLENGLILLKIGL